VKLFSHIKKVLGLIACLAALLPAKAVEFSATTWRSEEGLPHSIVTALVQTHDGYLWIATYVGLVRFDGTHFVFYSANEMPELGKGRIFKLFEDRSGTLWLSLDDGRLLSRKDGVLRVHFVGHEGLITDMVQDQQGTIWVQTLTGSLGKIVSNGINFVAKVGLVRPGLAIDAMGRLWVQTSDGIRLWIDGKMKLPPEVESIKGLKMDNISEGRNHSILATHDHHLYRIRFGQTLEEIELSPEIQCPVITVQETSDFLWVAAKDGRVFYRSNAGPWHAIAEEAGLLGANLILYVDHEGNLWRGSYGGGLTRLRPRLFTLHSPPVAGLDRYAFSVSADTDGSVWAMLNHQTSLVHIESDGKISSYFDTKTMKSSPRTLLCDRSRRVWIGNEKGMLYQLKSGKFEFWDHIAPQADVINCLFEDAQSNIWVGYTSGAGVSVIPNGDHAKLKDIEGISVPDVRAIAQTPDGAMWFGTHYGGLCRYKNSQWTQFTTKNGLPCDYVRCFYCEPNGTLWIGTLRGLCRYREGKFTIIQTENGLWHASLSHLECDTLGNLWMSSFGGVFHVSLHDLNDFADGKKDFVQCVGYSRDDGLPNLECPGGFQPSGTRSTDGRLWFPTAGGLVSIDPSAISKVHLPPPVWLEQLIVDGKPIFLNRTNTSVEIPPGKSRIEICYTAPNLTASEHVRFRHKLDKLEREFTHPEDTRKAVYSFVPPGHYRFQVIACSQTGDWNSVGAQIEILVRPFFWQTWWFKTLVVLSLAGTLIWSVRRLERWQTHQRLLRLEQRHALERERARIAKDIHDDLGASLTQIVFMSERIEKSKNDPGEVRNWNQKIANAARRTIQSMDEIVWAISPKHDTLESLANYLSQFSLEHLSLANVRCLLTVPTVLPQVEINAEIRHNLLMAAREALNNAVVHAHATEVRVTLRFGDESLDIIVEDNGCGFPPTSVEGNGLSNMRRRLEKIGGHFELASKINSGTFIHLVLPREKLHDRGIGTQPGSSSS